MNFFFSIFIFYYSSLTSASSINIATFSAEGDLNIVKDADIVIFSQAPVSGGNYPYRYTCGAFTILSRIKAFSEKCVDNTLYILLKETNSTSGLTQSLNIVVAPFEHKSATVSENVFTVNGDFIRFILAPEGDFRIKCNKVKKSNCADYWLLDETWVNISSISKLSPQNRLRFFISARYLPIEFSNYESELISCEEVDPNTKKKWQIWDQIIRGFVMPIEPAYKDLLFHVSDMALKSYFNNVDVTVWSAVTSDLVIQNSKNHFHCSVPLADGRNRIIAIATKGATEIYKSFCEEVTPRTESLDGRRLVSMSAYLKVPFSKEIILVHVPLECDTAQLLLFSESSKNMITIVFPFAERDKSGDWELWQKFRNEINSFRFDLNYPLPETDNRYLLFLRKLIWDRFKPFVKKDFFKFSLLLHYPERLKEWHEKRSIDNPIPRRVTPVSITNPVSATRRIDISKKTRELADSEETVTDDKEAVKIADSKITGTRENDIKTNLPPDNSSPKNITNLEHGKKIFNEPNSTSNKDHTPIYDDKRAYTKLKVTLTTPKENKKISNNEPEEPKFTTLKENRQKTNNDSNKKSKFPFLFTIVLVILFLAVVAIIIYFYSKKKFNSSSEKR